MKRNKDGVYHGKFRSVPFAWAKPMQNVSQTGNTGFTLAQLIAYPGIERGEPITIEHRPKKLEQVK